MATHSESTSGLKLLSREEGVPVVDLASLVLPLIILDSVNEAVARRLQVLPVRVDGGQLFVATPSPSNQAVIDEISFLSGKRVVAYAAHSEQLARAIDDAYTARRRGEIAWRGPRADKTPLEQAIAAAAVVPLDHVASQSIGPSLRQPDPPGAVPLMREPFSADSHYQAPNPPPDLAKRTRRRVLVVDDEPVIRRIMLQALSQRGYDVVEAAGGVDALRLIKEQEPDAILLDAMLPDVHGFEICRRLKTSRRYGHIPVLMMTAVYKGWRMAADLKDSYGVVATIEKPFNLHAVMRLLEQALAGQKPDTVPNAEAMSAEALRLYKEAAAAYKRGDINAAIGSLSASVAIDPLSASLRHQLGLLHAQAGHDFAAIQELETAVDLEPGRFQTLRNLAVLYQRHGFRRKASEMWERALAHAPDEATKTEIKQVLLQLL